MCNTEILIMIMIFGGSNKARQVAANAKATKIRLFVVAFNFIFFCWHNFIISVIYFASIAICGAAVVIGR